jgi:hypothetical protein
MEQYRETYKIQGQMQLKFYKAMAVPIMMYVSETSILMENKEKQTEAAELHFLRLVL